MNTNSIRLPAEMVQAEQQRFITAVYSWMTIALAVTAGVAMYVASVPNLASLFIVNRWLFYGLILIQFLLVASLAGWAMKMSANLATLVFLLYSAATGLTFSVIFLVFTAGSIAATFFVTAGTFAVMSAYGYLTKQDLTKWGSLLFMGLVGIILASLVNIFLKSSMLYWIVTYVGVFIFIGLVAYDTQKIKQMNVLGNEGTEEDRKEAIVGALVLYLDFINLFLLLLRIMGRRK